MSFFFFLSKRFFVFFFQAEDGIRDSDMWLEFQTCALPILISQLVPSWYPTCKIRCLMNQPPDAWLCPWLSQPKQNLLTTDLKGDINVLLTVQWMPLLSSSKAENKRPNIGYDWAIQFFKNCWLHRNWLTFDLGYGKGDDRDSICSLDWKRDVDQY